MSASATFLDIPLSTTFCADYEKSLLSLDWVLTSGIKVSASLASGVLSLPCDGSPSTCVMDVNLNVKDSLPFDLVLGRDWHLFCRDALPKARFFLSSGILDFDPRNRDTMPASQPCSMDIDAEPDADQPPRAVHLCACSEPLACHCPSSSHALHSYNLEPRTTSQNILRDILTARYRTRSRISVLYCDLKTTQHALTLHTIPHHDMDLAQCRQALIHHLITGSIAQLAMLLPGILILQPLYVYNEWQINTIDPDLQVHILSAIHGSKTSLNPMRRILTNLNVEHLSSDSLRILRDKLRTYILALRKGKRVQREQQALHESTTRFNEQLKQIRESWPQLVPQSLKDKLIKLFRERTSSEALTTFTCAACAEAVPPLSQCLLPLDAFNTDLIKRPDRTLDENGMLDKYKWLHPDCLPPPMPLDGNAVLQDFLLDPDGVSLPPDGGSPVLSLCSVCHSSLKNNKVPPLSLVNKLFLSPIPNELKDLTVIEEAMIARCRSKCWIVQLEEENQDLVLPTTQRGIKSHIIIYPQQPSEIAQILQPSVDEITSPVCVLFVGASPPTPEWLRNHAKPLAVNAGRVRAALQWLKSHNHLYKDVRINEECLLQLEENPILPFKIEHILPSAANEVSTARYDATPVPAAFFTIMADDNIDLFLRRTAIDDDGRFFYDQYTDMFASMGKASLAAHEFGQTFERTTDKKGRITYVTKPDGAEFTANIIGEIGSESQGSLFRASPAKNPPNLPLGDDANPHRMVISARCPTGATDALTGLWQNFLGCLDEVREADQKEELAANKKYKVSEMTVHEDNDLNKPADLIILKFKPTYEKPFGNATPQRTVRNSRARPSTTEGEDAEMAGLDSGSSARQVGDTYSPDMLPDHQGPYFSHQNARLVQRQIKDEDGQLIALHELYEKLVEGTLFSAQITLSTYIIKE
ncbi:ATP-dependent DNA helicase [Mycena sanguinolenta]|uniref:ATP-dependent DNA helicase n=1 Tax=Mycena sanguinolenta TaxID=230812 RepID=A0A8H6ZJ42_9AGAR|nr:ATP-dependent DNA helicase [Mycena sanguinolenta]